MLHNEVRQSHPEAARAEKIEQQAEKAARGGGEQPSAEDMAGLERYKQEIWQEVEKRMKAQSDAAKTEAGAMQCWVYWAAWKAAT